MLDKPILLISQVFAIIKQTNKKNISIPKAGSTRRTWVIPIQLLPPVSLSPRPLGSRNIHFTASIFSLTHAEAKRQNPDSSSPTKDVLLID